MATKITYTCDHCGKEITSKDDVHFWWFNGILGENISNSDCHYGYELCDECSGKIKTLVSNLINVFKKITDASSEEDNNEESTVDDTTLS